MSPEQKEDRKYFPIKPVADIGLQLDRSSDETKWSNVENLVRRRGGWRKRPGHPLACSDTSLPALALPGSVMAITEYEHPSLIELREIIRPDADGAHADWDTTDGGGVYFTEIDEDVSDDTDYISEADNEGKVSVGFANPGGAFASVKKITIRIRAERDAAENYSITVYSRAGGTDYEIGQVNVEATGDVEFAEFLLDAAVNPADDEPWEQADLDALEIVLEKAGVDAKVETLLPEEDGNYGDWGLHGASSFWAALASKSGNSYVARGDSPFSVSVKFADLESTYESISDVTIGWRRTKTDYIGNTKQDLFARKGGVDTVWVTNDTPAYVVGATFASGPEAGEPAHGLATNSKAAHPDGSAWTTAIVNALEIGFKSTSGTLRVIWNSYLEAVVTGIVSTTAKVSQLSVEIVGRTASTRTVSKLYVTDNAVYRVNEDLDTITNVNQANPNEMLQTAPNNRRYDYAQLTSKVFFTNGVDDIIYYPDGSNLFEQLSSQPIGRTCCTFINRLVLGDVTEGGVRSPQRIRWSDRTDGTGWSGATAGNLELYETPTHVECIRPIGAVLVAMKRLGIYNLTPTGDSTAPLRKTLRNPDVGCRAMASAQLISTIAGIPALIFLGESSHGMNVYMYDGAVCVPVGTEIAEELEDVMNTAEIQSAFSAVDRVGAEYTVFIAEGSDAHPKNSWTYNIRAKLWTKQVIQETTAAGTWTINDRRVQILGRADSLTYKLNLDVEADGLNAIESTLETGDYALGGREGYWTLYRAFVTYVDRGTMILRLDASKDKGQTYGGYRDHTLGGDDDASFKTASLEIDVTTGRRIRTRIRGLTANQPMDIREVVLEYISRDTVP